MLSRGMLSRGGPCGLTGGASERAPLSTVKLARVLLGTVDRQWQIPVLLRTLSRARGHARSGKDVEISNVKFTARCALFLSKMGVPTWAVFLLQTRAGLFW